MKSRTEAAVDVSQLEAGLLDLDPGVRAAALARLAELPGDEPPPPLAGPAVVNMHCHTFFSFNAYGHSPTSLAWLARQRGFAAAGIVDFDVLDGVDEFLDACELLGVRGSAGIETRVFVPEFGAREINSPGEPGVAYHMGIGFATGRVPAASAPVLADLGRRAADRNRALVERVNAYLDPVALDYERDVLPLTPAGNPTERHLVAAYVDAAGRATADPAAFWAGRLGGTRAEMAAVMQSPARFQNLIRAKLMKQGGAGYVPPESGMFPTMDAFHSLVVACGALPCLAWLDGLSEGEQAIEELLALAMAKGVAALNIIPDRNWNVADPSLRRAKVQNLYRIVELARNLDLPLNVGTEMNSFGQRLADDFDAPELAPLRPAFLDGAALIYGHTTLQRACSLGYQSEWAAGTLPSRRERNNFYTQVGRLVPPGRAGRALLRALPRDPEPGQVLAALGMISSERGRHD
jgi:hypothetical protein